MSLPTAKLADGRTVKLGRVRPTTPPECLRFASYRDPRGATPPPAVVDYSAKAMAAISRVYDNDTLGCCVIAGKMHQLGIWSGNETGTPVLATDTEVREQYVNICGPGDNGCVITNVLNAFQSPGLTAGGKPYTIDGFVSVDWTNKIEAQTAIYLFGSLTLGINLPQAWLQAPEGGLWDVTDTEIVGGHDVCAVGYNKTGVVVATWGGLRTITWAAFGDMKWLDECYAELAPLWYSNEKLAPCGVDADALRADLAALGSGTIPPIDPTPVPVVPPTPPAPAPLSAVAAGKITFTVPGGSKPHTVTVPVSLPVTFAPPQLSSPFLEASVPVDDLYYPLVRRDVQLALRTQGYRRADILDALDLATNELIDVAAAAKDIAAPDFSATSLGQPVTASGDIIVAIMAFLASLAGQTLIAEIIALITGTRPAALAA
jgi:hypothetical protein